MLQCTGNGTLARSTQAREPKHATSLVEQLLLVTALDCSLVPSDVRTGFGLSAVSARLCTRCGDAKQRVERAESGCRGTREVSFIQELLERIGCLGNVHGLCCAKRGELIVLYTEYHKRLRCASAPHFDWPKQFLHRISTAQPLNQSNSMARFVYAFGTYMVLAAPFFPVCRFFPYI